MDKVNKSFLYPSPKHIFLASEVHEARSDLSIRIADARVVHLLLVLHELDEAVYELKGLQQANLTNLVSDAVLACGFVDPAEARHAIAAVLGLIQGQELMPDSDRTRQDE
jgi:hypothetical protein